MITGHQIRAARALLGMTQEELAQASDVSLPTIKDFERLIREPRERSRNKLELALVARGIAFLNDDKGGVGVMLNGPLSAD